MAFGTEFWSAISGAMVGGLIALLIQLIALRAAINERNEEKKERNKALAHSIVFKVMRIHSNLYNLHLHLEESFSAADPQSHDEPFSFVLPLASSPADVHFTADEMSLVLSLKNPSLTDKLMSLDVIHNNLIDIFETYAGMRNDIQTMMPAEMEGEVGTSKLTEKEWLVVRPRMVMMNKLLTDTRGRAKTDYDDSRKAVDDLLKTINEKLGLELKVEVKAEKLDLLAKATTHSQEAG